MATYEEYKLAQAINALHEARLQVAAAHSNDALRRQEWLDEVKRLESEVTHWTAKVAEQPQD